MRKAPSFTTTGIANNLFASDVPAEFNGAGTALTPASAEDRGHLHAQRFLPGDGIPYERLDNTQRSLTRAINQEASLLRIDDPVFANANGEIKIALRTEVTPGVTNSSPRTTSYLLPSSGNRARSDRVQRRNRVAMRMQSLSSWRFPCTCAEVASARRSCPHHFIAQLCNRSLRSLRSAAQPSQGEAGSPRPMSCHPHDAIMRHLS